ncbi:MAG: hypothetical protein R3F35_16745 [Myxococcota bacterium]
MHRFLTVFLCLSTLAMAQNVVAGTPRPVLDGDRGQAIAQTPGERVLSSGVELSQAVAGGQAPSPGTMMLFVTGLAGLSAVGRRRTASPQTARS